MNNETLSYPQSFIVLVTCSSHCYVMLFNAFESHWNILPGIRLPMSNGYDSLRTPWQPG